MEALGALVAADPAELAEGVRHWLVLVESGQLTMDKPAEQRFVRFLYGTAAACEAAGHAALPRGDAAHV